MIGQSIAHYEIGDKIGEGGMGVVYRARDTKLGRDVALKVLPEQFARDPQRMGRFEREARLLASLNHSNIASIFGLEESNGVRALVMELVEGPTLADRIDEGAIPLDEALALARQIADALEYAHEHGVIHRDLKPANVKLTADGAVKVLDFGLAKAMEDDPSSGDPAMSPTLTFGATKAGVILGTAAYMAPEQARGKAVDKRADIWSFGVVLYEMLTSKRLFRGEDMTDTLARVVRDQPDLSDAPAKLRRLLTRCLEKDPKKRLQHIGDAWELLQDEAPAQAPAVAVRSHLPWLLAGAVAGGLAIGLIVWALTRQQPQAVVRTPIPLAEGQDFSNTGRPIVAISPDGARIVHTANGELWLRPLDQWESTHVSGTEDGPAIGPFFSADGEWIGFFSGGELKKVSVTGGAPVTLCELGAPFGASWGDDNMILYGQGPEGIWRVPATGGAPEQVIAVEEGESAYGPQMLPGGEWVLFTLRPSGVNSWNQAQVVVQSIETGERTALVEGGHDARYLPTGHLVYALMAVAFDVGARRIAGGAVPLVEGVQESPNTGAAQFDLSTNGTLVYVLDTGAPSSPERLVWLNQNGMKAGEILQTAGQARDFVLSPDERRVAYWESDQGNWDIWVLNLARGDRTRITNAPSLESRPIWSPDGEWLAFTSSRTGNDIFLKRADGSGEEVALTETEAGERLSDWSRDGRYLLYERGTNSTGWDLWYLERGEDGSDWEPHEFLATPDSELVPKLSPDGRYVAYVSNESGEEEVYVQPFPEGGRRWTVSTNGGRQPRWSRDGSELFYLEGDTTLMAVEVSTAGEFSAGAPQRLFEHPGLGAGLQYPRYDLSRDGQRFLAVEPVGGETGQTAPPAIRVVQNWFN